MKRMWSKNELKSIVDTQAKEIQKDIATLVDKNGHPRFIEGAITIETIEGVSQSYGKWSLSGTHLMVVVALSIDDTIALSDNQTLANINIPKWIYDKIVPIKSDVIMNQVSLSYKTSWATVNFGANLTKSSNKLHIKKAGNFTASTQNIVRVAFDLLIDNE